MRVCVCVCVLGYAHVYVCVYNRTLYYLCLHLLSAPSGPPKSLALTSISQHNVTIQWDPVDCLDRNGDITVYRVRYGLTSRTERETRLTDENTRMFTVTGFFWPRTTYTFEVEAFNVAELLIGPTASIAIVTPPSERK